MTVFLQRFLLWEILIVIKSNSYRANTLGIHRIPTAGVWPHGLPCRGTRPLTRHAARPSIPLPGALNTAMVKYPG
jgi:hypothetical protein